MGCTKIDVSAIVGLSNQISSSKNTVSDVRDSVNAIRGQIDGRILGRNNLSARFSSATSQLMNIESRIGKVKTTTENGANRYQQTDIIVAGWKNEMIGNINSISQDVSGGGRRREGNVIETSMDEDTKSWFAKFINNELKTSDSYKHGEVERKTEFLGIDITGKANGDFLTYEVETENDMSWKFKDENGNWDFKSFGISSGIKIAGSVAQGEVEGKIGYLHEKISGKAVTGAAKGEVKAKLWDAGKFQPGIYAGVEGEISLLQGEAEIGFGTDQYGVYTKAEGDFLHAEASAEIGFGSLGTDNDGQEIYGAKAEVNAMACIAQGEAKSGITIFGVDIDIGIEGYAGAVGVEAGGSITTEGVKAKIGGSLVFGAGVNISVDWSDAKWIGESVDAVGDFVGNVTDFVGEAAGDFVDGAANVVEDVGDFLFGWID